MDKMKQKKSFLFVSGDAYPAGDAGAVRTHAFAQICDCLGLKPIVIGMGESTDFQKATYENVEYYSMRYPKQNLFYRVLGRVLYTHNLKQALKSIDLSNVDGIMAVTVGIPTLKYLKNLTKKRNIPLYYDCVEWYSPSEFKSGEKSKTYRDNEEINTNLIDESVNVISISSFLHESFLKRKVHSIQIPVIMDVLNMPYKAEPEVNEKVQIIYAGSPGTKDRISEVVKAMEHLSDEEAEKIQIHFIGVTQQQYEERFGVVCPELLNRAVFFEGRKPRSYVIEQLQNADFSFLMRPEQERYAKAGFPTKSVEALSSGTAMLCNLTSDLGMYLKDKENSIIIEDCSEEACLKALKRVLSLSPDERKQMKLSSRKTAEQYFDWRIYSQQFHNFAKETGE